MEPTMETPEFFSTKTGTLGVIIRNITDVVREINMGQHRHAMFENIGANPVFVSPNQNASNAVQWLEPNGNKVLDDYSDQKVYLVCGAGLTTQIRITAWG